MKTLKLTIPAVLASLVMLSACSSAARPPQSEFGLGPRVSSQGSYEASIQPPQEPMRPRKMQSIQIAVKDSDGRPLEGATIAVDGGMPQHGHGLPTRPRVTKTLGGGVYQIDGLRFNMGGWWELRLAITGAAGTEEVTFNLQV